MKRWSLVLIVLLVVSVVPITTFGIASAAETTVQLSPTDDAYVKDTAPNSNYGSSGSLYVGTYYRDHSNERAYLKFDLSSLPDNAVIVSATLHAYTYSGAYSKDVNISVYAVDNDSWTEDSITWNSKPSEGQWLDRDLVGTAGKHWSIWNVTDFVKSEFNGDKVVSFVLISDSEGALTESIGYNSKESSHGNHPYLEIIYEVPQGPHYQSIKEIRENWTTGRSVVTSGIVIGTRSTGFFIQNGTEPNSGIYVYVGSSFAKDVKSGDVVQVNGTTTTWHGLYEIGSPTYKVVGHTDVPDPVLVTASEMNDSYQSMRVKLEWVRVTNVDGKDVTVEDDTGSLSLYDYYGIMDVVPGKILEYVIGIGYRYNVMEVYPTDYKIYIPSIGISKVVKPNYAINGIPMNFKVTVVNNGNITDNVTVALYANGVVTGNITKEIEVGGSEVYELTYVPTTLGDLTIDIQVLESGWGIVDERIYEYKVVPNPNVLAYGLTPYYERLYNKEMSNLTPLYENFTETVSALEGYGVDFGDLTPKIQGIEDTMAEIQRQYEIYNALKRSLLVQNPNQMSYYYAVMIHIRKAAFMSRDVLEEVEYVLPYLQATLEQIEASIQPPAPENQTNTTETGNETNVTPSNQSNVTPATNITIHITRVLIDAGHGQYYVKEVGINNLTSKIQDELGWEVDINKLPLTYDLLKDYDVVILLDPGDDLTNAEVQAIQEYVENGGGLFIAGEWYKYANTDNFNAIVGKYGIRFNPDELMDDDHNSGRPYYPFVGIYNTAHPAMKFVPNDWTMYYNGQTLTISGSAVWLIKAYDTGYSVDANGNVVYAKGTEPVLAAAVEAGSGRIVAYGSSRAFSDSYYMKYIGSNWPFIKGALLWLAHQE